MTSERWNRDFRSAFDGDDVCVVFLQWRDAWFSHGETVYLNAAGQAPMPRVALEAVQASLEWKKYPYTMTDGLEREIPARVRASLADDYRSAAARDRVDDWARARD